MDFQFVENDLAADPAVRKRIRRHVAKGKNAGRTLVRPSKQLATRPKPQTLKTPFRPPPVTNGPSGQQDTTHETYAIEPVVGDHLSLLLLHYNPCQRFRRVLPSAISFYTGVRYTPQIRCAFRAPQGPSMWIKLLFADEAYHHMAIAVSILSMNNMVAEREHPAIAMHHLSLTFRLLEQRLCGTDAISDVNIAVVVILAQYERLQDRYLQGLVHLQGLQRMIDMRGGISKLMRERPVLSQKIIRLELEYAFYLGSATRFHTNDILDGRTGRSLLSNISKPDNDVQKAEFLNTLSPVLRGIMVDTLLLTRILNDACKGVQPQIDMYQFHEDLLVLGYRLIDFRALKGPRPSSPRDHIVHLGIVTYMIPYFHKMDRTIPATPLLAELIRSAVYNDPGLQLENAELILWLLFLGGVSILTPHHDSWLLPVTLRAMCLLQLRTWDDVVGIMTRYLWVDLLHGKAGQDFFHNRVLPLREPITDVGAIEE